MVSDRGAELVQRYGEVRIAHLPGQSFAQGLPETVRSVDAPFVAGHEEGREEGQTLDVVPVHMADQHVARYGPDSSCHQGPSEIVRAGATIEHHERAGC